MNSKKILHLKEKILLAERDCLTFVEIDFLAKDKNFEVRRRIAGHKNLPSEIVTLLAQDKEWQIQELIAERKDLTQEQMNLLLHEEIEYVRAE